MATRSLWRLFGRPVLVKNHVGKRFICGGYNEDASNLTPSVDRGAERRKIYQQSQQRQSEFPEFMVNAGKGQAHLQSSDETGKIPELLHTESFAFQEERIQRHHVVRDYQDETGQIRQKRDYAEDNIERTWRDNTGRPVELRREKEIKTEGFPEAFTPRPMPHPDPAFHRESNPIVKREAEMHLPQGSYKNPNE